MKADPAYRREYQVLEPEFALIEAMIQARAYAYLTRAQLARRMGTMQAVIARLESGRTKPSTRTAGAAGEGDWDAAADYVRADWSGIG